MSNKKLSFEQAVKSGKDFFCIETGEMFYPKPRDRYIFDKDGCIHIFDTRWLHQEFEIIEVKKEFTASEIEEAFEHAWANSHHADKMKENLLKKLGFKLINI